MSNKQTVKAGRRDPVLFIVRAPRALRDVNLHLDAKAEAVCAQHGARMVSFRQETVRHEGLVVRAVFAILEDRGARR